MLRANAATFLPHVGPQQFLNFSKEWATDDGTSTAAPSPALTALGSPNWMPQSPWYETCFTGSESLSISAETDFFALFSICYYYGEMIHVLS